MNNLRSACQTVFVVLAMLATTVSVRAQGIDGRELAHRLANSNTQQRAIQEVVAAGRAYVPLLLSWTRKAPDTLDKYDQYNLKLAIAQVFGRLKTLEAISFLIKNISLQVGLDDPNTWMKTGEVIEKRMPAVAALIQIGPAASKALLHIPFEQVPTEDRLPVIFTISRIPGVPGARVFLATVAGEANMERFRAQEGLHFLDQQR
jgi:hypothetical protein